MLTLRLKPPFKLLIFSWDFLVKNNSPIVPGNQAHKGFLCKSVLLFPTLISKSCKGWWPQHPLVVTLTTLTAYALSKSTCHQGLASFWVSEHFFVSWSLLNSPSLALRALPPLTVVDWLAGFRKAMFTPVTQKFAFNNLHVCNWWLRPWTDNVTKKKLKLIIAAWERVSITSLFFTYLLLKSSWPKCIFLVSSTLLCVTQNGNVHVLY